MNQEETNAKNEMDMKEENYRNESYRILSNQIINATINNPDFVNYIKTNKNPDNIKALNGIIKDPLILVEKVLLNDGDIRQGVMDAFNELGSEDRNIINYIPAIKINLKNVVKTIGKRNGINFRDEEDMTEMENNFTGIEKQIGGNQ